LRQLYDIPVQIDKEEYKGCYFSWRNWWNF